MPCDLEGRDLPALPRPAVSPLRPLVRFLYRAAMRAERQRLAEASIAGSPDRPATAALTGGTAATSDTEVSVQAEGGQPAAAAGGGGRDG